MNQKEDLKSINIRDFAKTVLILCSVALVSLMLNHLHFLDSNLIMVFIFGVVLISVSTNRLFGLIASISSVVIFNFLFTDPKYTFAVADSQYIFTLLIMLAVALIISALTIKEKTLAREAEKREFRTNVLLNMTRSLLTLNGQEDICREALNQLQNAVNGIPAIELLHPGRLENKTLMTVLNDFSQSASEISKGKEILKLSIQGAEILHGHLFIYPEKNPQKDISDDEKSLINTFNALLSLALDRDRIIIQHEDVKIRAENEKLRSTILRSISHDLRTPLAGITGATTTLLENSSSLEEEMRLELLKGIYDEASWLSNLVDNILSLSKVQSSGGLIRKTPEVLEDVLFSAAQKTRKRFGRHHLTVQPPDDVILVPMDAVLIEQVLINLLDNAVSHTPEGTEVILSACLEEIKDKQNIKIRVSDNGPGIPLGIMPHIFDLFKSSSISNTKSRGSGLGLGICKAIVEAHGGQIEVMNHMNGGAAFSFSLPVDGKEILQ